MPLKQGFSENHIISDRGVNATQVAVPALLALSAIHQHLVREGLRTTAGLVVETATAREVHHFAVLAGYGAEAVHPYLAMETLQSIHKDLPGALSADKAIYNYVKAIGKGLSKIMSKMGVSTYMSYCGAQLFEAIGINSETVAKYFTGTPSRIGGISLETLAEDGHTAFGEADLVIVVGTPLDFRIGYGRGTHINPDAKIIQVDINPNRIGLTKKVSVGIVGDAKKVAEGILAKLSPSAGDAGREERHRHAADGPLLRRPDRLESRAELRRGPRLDLADDEEAVALDHEVEFPEGTAPVARDESVAEGAVALERGVLARAPAFGAEIGHARTLVRTTDTQRSRGRSSSGRSSSTFTSFLVRMRTVETNRDWRNMSHTHASPSLTSAQPSGVRSIDTSLAR